MNDWRTVAVGDWVALVSDPHTTMIVDRVGKALLRGHRFGSVQDQRSFTVHDVAFYRGAGMTCFEPVNETDRRNAAVRCYADQDERERIADWTHDYSVWCD